MYIGEQIFWLGPLGLFYCLLLFLFDLFYCLPAYHKLRQNEWRFSFLQLFLISSLHGKLDVQWTPIKLWNMCWGWLLLWCGPSFFPYIMLVLVENILVIQLKVGVGLESGAILPIWLQLHSTWWPMQLTWFYFLCLWLESISRPPITGYACSYPGGLR